MLPTLDFPEMRGLRSNFHYSQLHKLYPVAQQAVEPRCILFYNRLINENVKIGN